ncbi:DMT family transporter [Chthonobacter albigriseus]|uniref:DMT family transporter n=1 Tax=Chthonobacter albigriseus TaxID=1683161 RepID=UPI0015EEBE0B|nr:DMT family transporter [Chthonobacter albigriseus]
MTFASRRTYGIVLVTLGTITWSTGGLFVRLLPIDLWTILFWRSIFAGLSLMAMLAVMNGGRVRESFASLGRPGLLAIPLSAISMVSYVASLNFTTVANVMTIYATLPFVAAAVAWVWTREQIGRRVAIASLVAFAGILIVAGSATHPEDVLGNALAFAMTASFAVILVMARLHPGIQMAPVNGLAAFVCAAACWPLVGGPLPTPFEFAVLAAFGFTTSGLAYLLFLTGGKHIPASEAGLIGLLDVVLGPFWVWLAFAEEPGLPAILGGSLVLAAVGWYLAGELRRPAVNAA